MRFSKQTGASLEGSPAAESRPHVPARFLEEERLSDFVRAVRDRFSGQALLLKFAEAPGRIQAESLRADFELLARYRPEVFQGYINLRQAAFNTGPGAALTPREKELIILAIEIGRTKTNPPPVGHAKRAIESGATPAEIAEVASLCILIGGMLTYQESGRQALRAAEELYAELHPEG